MTNTGFSGESAQFALDAISSSLAVLNERGDIVATNMPWREFSHANGGPSAAYGAATNYLSVCDEATGTGSEGGRAMAEGIRAVMRGSKGKFELEYRCDSPTERRQFIARVTRFDYEGKFRIVVTHDDISKWGKLEYELSEQSETISMRTSELATANKELRFQMRQKADRAVELAVANEELHFQMGQKANRAAELVIANVELAYQSGEKEKRADELAIAKHQTETANIASLAKSSFLANMSHEIRTPLSAISGMAKLIQMEPLSRTQADRMQKLEASVLHLSSTINNILDLSKIEANKLVLDEVPVNMDDLVDQVVHMLLHRTEAKGLQLLVDVDRMPLGLLGDTTRLTQALLNFAGNAVKFTSKGSISIAASVLEDGVGDALVKLEVQDTGVGIAAETIDTLFQPFVQADASTTRQHGGTGLGLVISKRLAEAMGGTIGFHSELGTGSTFWFTARLRKSSLIENFVPYVPIEDVALTLKRDYAGRRVLLAEDDEFNREIGEILLQNVGLLVDLAVDGQEAVEMALRNKYDLVLMDMQMPKMDGLEATRCIRSASGNSMSIVAMTANAFIEDRESCMAAGMNEFITKPVDPSKLYQIILRELRVVKS
jgi:signal transduction histidine kinase/ActR/RegA family two-component response regulator